MTKTVRVAITSTLDPVHYQAITGVSPSVSLLADPDLIAPRRFSGDHEGDPGFVRSPAQQAAFERLLADADILYGIPDGRPASLAAAIRANPDLSWVHTMAAGGGAQVRMAGLSAQELRRVVFTTSAGVHGTTLAEFALFGVLAGAKDLPVLQALQRDRRWAGRWPMRQVGEQTILVVGLGGIGREVARLMKAVGAGVIGVKRRPEPVACVDEVHPIRALPELVGRADAIVFTLPGTAATEGLYSRELIAATKPGAVVVNVGRGTVIDEDALVDALDTGRLSSAYLDVFAVEPLPTDSRLWTMPQVVLAPHTAALSPHEEARIVALFADNLDRWLNGRELHNVVDTHEFY